eukprot:c7551_g1_i1 orf=889-2001(+)
MQDRGLKPPQDIPACSRPPMERRLKPPNDQVLKCPRCDSYNTKFCYYNNYSLSQPRYFCKNCRRYWTRGGALRNVPVGGGCRKNKRSKQRSAEAPSTSYLNESTTDMEGESTSCAVPNNVSPMTTSSSYFRFPIEGDGSNLPALARSHQTMILPDQNLVGACSPRIFGVTGSGERSPLPHSTIVSLIHPVTGLGGMQPFRNGLLGLEHFTSSIRPDQGHVGVGDVSVMFDAVHQQLSLPTAASAPMTEGLGSFTLDLDILNARTNPDMHWKFQHPKKSLRTEKGCMSQGQEALTLESDQKLTPHSFGHSTHQGLDASFPSSTNTGEECHPTVDWQTGQEGFFDATIEHNYWSNGTWSDLSSYVPSTSAFL